MPEITVIKTPSGWSPLGDEAAEVHARQKTGAPCTAVFKQPRNYRFHKKYFALLNLAFDYWETGDQEYKGSKVQRNFDRFRKDVQILAGYYEPVYNIRGELRLESKSISFGKMSQEEFDKLYGDVLNVLLERVLKAKGFTKERVNEVVDQIMEFA